MNIAEIAKQAGVSPATVSRVINGTAFVKEETRMRVMEVIEKNRYVPNLAARNLGAQSVSNNIGLFVPDMDNPFFSSIVKGVTQIADQYGYNTFLFNTDENPEREHRFLQTVREQNLRGIIMIPLAGEDGTSEQYLQDLELNHVPVVLVDRQIGNSAFDCVFTDDEADAYRAVQVLIDAGHTRIATIAGPQRSTPGYARLRGFERAMRDNGLQMPKEYVRIGNFKLQMAYEEVTELLRLPQPPTAIFAANNFSTLGALQSITEHKLVIGEDIAILGFDEIERWHWYPWLAQCNVGLSLVERPIKQLVNEAVNLLQGRITGTIDQGYAKRKLMMGNQIVLRGSERITGLQGTHEGA